MFDRNVSYAQIESQTPDEENLPVFLPFLYGERCPGWQGQREAVFCGVKPAHSDIDLYFSVMEGVLFKPI